MKYTKLDQLFSHYVRGRDGWSCTLCHRHLPSPTVDLQCSHFHSRGKQGTRFDPENCDAFCVSCHLHMEHHKDEYTQWKLQQIGPERFDALTLRANGFCGRSEEDTLAYIKTL